MTATHALERGTLTNHLTRLNTTWHEPALWLYATVVVLHWIEHLFQGYQIWILDLPRAESLGAVGAVFPWLVSSELMHFGFAVFMLAGLAVLLPGFSGTAAKWWIGSLVIQAWHFVEHALLQGQVAAGANLFHSDAPMSVFQQWIPRAELHLLYNLLVFIPMVVAMVIHARPRDDSTADTCTCALEAN